MTREGGTRIVYSVVLLPTWWTQMQLLGMAENSGSQAEFVGHGRVGSRSGVALSGRKPLQTRAQDVKSRVARDLLLSPAMGSSSKSLIDGNHMLKRMARTPRGASGTRKRRSKRCCSQ